MLLLTFDDTIFTKERKVARLRLLLLLLLLLHGVVSLGVWNHAVPMHAMKPMTLQIFVPPQKGPMSLVLPPHGPAMPNLVGSRALGCARSRFANCPPH